MNETQKPDTRKSSVADHLANERTFLAWIRTAIALMGFGFVIVKFALFIRQIGLVLGGKNIQPGKGYSAIIGVIMVALGAVIASLAYLRYRNIEKQLNQQTFFPSPVLSFVLTLCVLIGSIFLVLYLLSSI